MECKKFRPLDSKVSTGLLGLVVGVSQRPFPPRVAFGVNPVIQLIKISEEINSTTWDSKAVVPWMTL